MTAYIIRRLLLIIPTLFGIMIINFAVIQIVPGGPVEQMIAEMTGTAIESTARFSGAGEGENINFDAGQVNALCSTGADNLPKIFIRFSSFCCLSIGCKSDMLYPYHLLQLFRTKSSKCPFQRPTFHY